MKPYVSLTGLNNITQAGAILDGLGLGIFQQTTHNLALGILASDKQIGGGTNTHPRRYPPLTDHAIIFSRQHERVYEVVHVCTDQPDVNPVLQEMLRESEYIPHGFQLNVIWPKVGSILAFREFLPSFAENIGSTRGVPRTILQLSAKTLLWVRPRAVADIAVPSLLNRLEPYVETGAIDAVLYDMSGGRGLDLDVKEAHFIISHLERHFGDKLRIGVAGGLRQDNLNRLRPLAEAFPGRISVDTESGIRTIDNRLDTDQAIQFAQKGFHLLSVTETSC